jgi:hypothetical protein
VLFPRIVIATAPAVGLLNTPASADKRVALVIGNGAYQHTERLLNPKNDAEHVSAALRRTGFEAINYIGFRCALARPTACASKTRERRHVEDDTRDPGSVINEEQLA